MTTALEQLAELVRQAEARTRARKIEGETLQAVEQFRSAEERARRAVEKYRVGRSTSLRALEQCDVDEQLLKDLVRKLALYKSSLGSQADAERLIAASQAEIERTRQQARAELDEMNREVEEARRELRSTTDTYRQLRRELDRLQPELAAQFATGDRLLWDAESHFPGGQLQLLGHEVDAGLSAFGTLSKLEQYARLKVWIGRFRAYQASQERSSEQTEDLQALSHRVFHQLKWLSRQYEPGYIEAFRQDFSTDWSVYVGEAQEQLAQAIDASRRARSPEVPPPRDRLPSAERASFSSISIAGTTGPLPSTTSTLPSTSAVPQYVSYSSLAELKTLVLQGRLPDEGLDRFLAILRQAVDDVGTTNSELLRLAWPFREYITGDDGLGALKRNLQRIQACREVAKAHKDS